MLERRRTPWIVAALIVALGLGACGGPAPSPPSSTGPVTETIGAEGGVLDAVAVDGTRFELEIPPGGLREPTDLTLDPDENDATALASARLTPADLVFDLPATFRVDFPPDRDVSEDAVLVLGPPEDRTFVATERVGPRTLATEQRLFEMPALAEAGLRTTQGGGGGGQVGAVTAACQNQLDSAQITLDGLLATNAYERAIRLKLATAALAVQCALDPASVTWLDDLPAIACARYEDLALIATTTAADTYDTFVELISPLLNWSSQMQNLGVDCPGARPVADLILDKYQQFVTFYSDVVANSITSEFEQIVDEVNKVYTLRGRASLLGAADAETLLETQVLFPLMNLLRERGYELCNSDRDHYYLSSLLEAIFTTRRIPIGSFVRFDGGSANRLAPQSSHAAFDDDALQGDLQVCASQATVEVWADPAVPYEVTDQRRELDGGTSPGGGTLEADAMAPYEGYLVVRGDVAAFRCGQARTIENDQLVFEFEGREADRASASGGTMLGSPVELDVSAMAQSASLDPDSVHTAELVFVREGGACSGTYGDGRDDIFTLQLTIDPAPSTSSVSAAPTTLTAGSPTTIAFSLAFADRGENLESLAVTFSLQGDERSAELDVASAPELQGFAAATGTGTYTQALLVECSEQPKNPLEARFELVDEFDQRSTQISTSLTVDYSGCAAQANASTLPGIAGTD